MTDFKTSDRDVNRAIRSWLHEDRHEDVSRIAGAVLDQVDTIPQRRATWWPARRTPTVNRIFGFGLAAAAVVVVLIVGAQFVGSPGTGGLGAGPTATPESTVTPEPSPSPPASPPPLTQSFTSTQHGISMSYPEGWTARAATEPLTDRPGVVPQYLDPGFDVLHDPVLTDHLFLAIASQPIGDSTPEEWVAALMTGHGCTTAEPIAVDGATGLIGANDCDAVAFTTAGRGYQILLLTSDDDPVVVAPYDTAWFEEVLATVQLHPEDAVE
jgi:hypothetical protein